MDQREYSVYSGENDDYLEILVKEISDGNVSVKLKNCKPGQVLNINGPFGSFCLEDYDRYSRKLVFIATGTGISPFHSIVRSCPKIDYILLHGVSFRNEAYEKDEYDAARYFLCTSREKYEGRKGRVTNYLLNFRVNPDMLFYLCGNGSMIYEVYHILRNKGVPTENIFSEIYFE
jgi:ferredoxin--NADP+ reductase/benzoate/toluate 1,2-dioxygenase reductase subunit